MGYVFDFRNSDVVVVDVMGAKIGPTVVPVLYRHDGTRTSIEGSAFCIASSPDSPQALYVTARHVVEQLVPPRLGVEPFVLIPGNELHVDGATPRYLHAVPIKHVTMAETYCDVAVLIVDRSDSPTEGIVPKTLRLSSSEPAVGEHCMALGYPQNVDELLYILQASRGRIEEVHPRQRDSSLVDFPSFRTTGTYLPSMSGGPIVADDMDVIGVVSTGTDTADGQPLGYGACVASILELTVNMLDGNGVRRDFRIPDLLREGYIKRGDGDLEMTRTPGGVELRWL
ncbi:serine protease [Mycobacterium colombiense]